MRLQLLLAALTVTATACASAAARTPGADGSPSSRARGPLTVALSTHVASEPAQVVVRTRIEPDARNRALTIHWWNADGIGGSHSVSLEGQRAPMRHDCSIKSMGAGEYVVTAVLTRNDGKQVHRTTRVIVIPEGGRLDVEQAAIWLGR